MGKGFLKLKGERAGLPGFVLAVGMLISVILAIKSAREAAMPVEQLLKNEAGEEGYEQELRARIGTENIKLNIEVDPKILSEEEAAEQLVSAEVLLDRILLGENESFDRITTDLCFTDKVDETQVSVEWTETISEYFESDGSFKENLQISQSIEKEVTAILCCQNQTRDYRRILTIAPRELSKEYKLGQLVELKKEEQLQESYLTLPDRYEGQEIQWKNTADLSFLHFGILTIIAAVFLKLGQKKDLEKEKRQRSEALEQEYPSVVSKFAMLLSTGLSIRSAWERIVALENERKQETQTNREMNWAVREMRKGVSELSVYEEFGKRTGLLHYKKLMALFITHKKRGSIDLIEVLNQEMLQAWEERRRLARTQGEKIGTKLLMPMMGMLFVVFLIILVPAFLSF